MLNVFLAASMAMQIQCGLDLMKIVGAKPSRELATEIATSAEMAQVPASLLFALIAVESAFKPDAVSPAGATGLTQIMPKTRTWLRGMCGKSPSASIGEDLHLATCYLQYFRRGAQDPSWTLPLAGYNGGPRQVKYLLRGRRLHVETANYIVKIQYLRYTVCGNLP